MGLLGDVEDTFQEGVDVVESGVEDTTGQSVDLISAGQTAARVGPVTAPFAAVGDAYSFWSTGEPSGAVQETAAEGIDTAADQATETIDNAADSAGQAINNALDEAASIGPAWLDEGAILLAVVVVLALLSPYADLANTAAGGG